MNPDTLVADVDGLSCRSRNCLLRETDYYNRPVKPITTVGEVWAASDAELLRINNLGRTSLAEIRRVIGPKKPEEKPHVGLPFEQEVWLRVYCVILPGSGPVLARSMADTAVVAFNNRFT